MVLNWVLTVISQLLWLQFNYSLRLAEWCNWFTSNWFGFGFKTLNWKPLYYKKGYGVQTVNTEKIKDEIVTGNNLEFPSRKFKTGLAALTQNTSWCKYCTSLTLPATCWVPISNTWMHLLIYDYYQVHLSIECNLANNLWYNKGFINTAWRVFGSLLLQTFPREIYNAFTGW